jgi:hypothetical protein
VIKLYVFAGSSAEDIAQGEADLNALRAAGWSVVGFSSLIVILQK